MIIHRLFCLFALSFSFAAYAKPKADVLIAKKVLTNEMTIESHLIKGKSTAQLQLKDKHGKLIDQQGFGPPIPAVDFSETNVSLDSGYFTAYKSFDSQIPFFEMTVDRNDGSEISSNITQFFYIYKNKIVAGASFESIGQGEGGLLMAFDSKLLSSKKQVRLLVGINKAQKEHLPKLAVVRTEGSATDEANLMVVEKYWSWTGSAMKETVNFEYEKLPVGAN